MAQRGKNIEMAQLGKKQQIFIETPRGKTIAVNVNANDTVGNVIKKARKKGKINVVSLILREKNQKGKQLNKCTLMRNVNWQTDKRINAAVRTNVNKVDVHEQCAIMGGYANIKGIGKRKIRSYKNGDKYVIINGHKKRL